MKSVLGICLVLFAFAIAPALPWPLAWPATARADGPVDDGLAAYQKGDFATALKLWLPAAEKGHVIAQNNLAILYDRGQGVKKNSTEAFKWYQRAAEAGHSHAQYNLGRMYDNGEAVDRDAVFAFKWFTLAALGGRREFVHNRITYSKLLSKSEIDRAELLAAGWISARKAQKRKQLQQQ